MDNKYLDNIHIEKISFELFSVLEIKKNFQNKYGFDPFDNYKYREIMSIFVIQNIDISVKLKMRGRHGEDYINYKSKYGEIKTSLNKNKNKINCHFEFDKQNDKNKRDKVLEIDSLVFTVFERDSFIPLEIIYINNDNSIKTFRNIISRKQNDFLIKYKDKKINRDSIQIKYSDICNIEDIVIVKKDRIKEYFKNINLNEKTNIYNQTVNVEITDNELREWKKNINNEDGTSINPKTKRRIKNTGVIYKNLEKEFEKRLSFIDK